MFKDYNINNLMNNINIIINDFLQKNSEFNENQLKEIVSQVILNQEYDKNLYKLLIDKNFELFQNKIYNQISNKINLKMFNKLIYPKQIENFYHINDYLKFDDQKVFSSVFKNLDKENFYVYKINQIWNLYSDNLTKTNIKFIEKDFNGNFEEYLLFIIPRITKLNKNQLDKLLPDMECDLIDSITEEEVNSEDNEYIKILELNINNLQSELQNIKDNIIPKVNNFERNLNITSDQLKNHQKQTKSSFEVMEERISKLIQILNTTKL